MSNDSAQFNLISTILNDEVQLRSLSFSHTSTLSPPWLMTFCFLVNAHYYTIHGESLFNDDFIIGDDSGTFLHKQISEQILCLGYTLDNDCMLLNDKSSVSEYNMSYKLRIKDIVSGLVECLYRQDNDMNLAGLLYDHKIYDAVAMDDTPIRVISPQMVAYCIKSYYNFNTKPKHGSDTSNSIILFPSKHK